MIWILIEAVIVIRQHIKDTSCVVVYRGSLDESLSRLHTPPVLEQPYVDLFIKTSNYYQIIHLFTLGYINTCSRNMLVRSQVGS